MEFFQSIIGADGCTVEGSMTQNPFTSFMGNMFDSSTLSGVEFDEQQNNVMLEENEIVQGNGAHFGGFFSGLPMHYPMPLMNFRPYNQFDSRFEDNTVSSESIKTFKETVEIQDSSDHVSARIWEDLERNLHKFSNDSYKFEISNEYFENLKDSEAIDEDILAMYDRAMGLYHAGSVKQAILLFEAVIQQSEIHNFDDVYCDSWRMLGVCNAENDEDKKAIQCYHKAIEADPYNLDALLALGTSYVNELDSVNALTTLKCWVEHNPKFHGMKVQGDAYANDSLMDEVTQLMLHAAAFDPGDVDVQVVLGTLYNVSQDYGAAVECFRTAMGAAGETYSLLNKIAATHANNAQPELAIPYYAQSLKMRPMYARGWLNLGISFASMNQYEQAAKAYVQALHLSPSARHIWGYLRVVLNCLERMDLVELSGTENVQALAQQLQLELL